MIDVVIQGTGKLGQMVFYLLRESTKHRVVAFAADREYCTTEQLLGVPLIPFDQVERQFPPDGVGMLTVLGGLGGWAARKELYDRATAKGYRHLNYVHPTAVVQGDQHWGDNNIVFPFAIVGFDGQMGNNNVLREKVYLGHDFVIGDHTFIGVGCTIGGGARIGDGGYLAMGSTVTNDITVGAGTFLGIGSLLLRDTDPHAMYLGHPAKKVTPASSTSAPGSRA